MKDTVRLLVVGVAWPMETFLERLMRSLAMTGFQITLATETRPDQNRLDETGIQWLSAPLWRGRSLRTLGRLTFNSVRSFFTAPKISAFFWKSTSSCIRWRDRLASWYSLIPYTRPRWDVIYFPWNISAINHLPLFELGMPVVISCRGSQILIAPHNPRRVDALSGLRMIFDKAAAVHCVSEDILRQASLLGLNSEKAQVIFSAVDTRFFYPSETSHREGKPFHIVTTGSINWVKGFEYALLAVRQLKDLGLCVRFEIIGDGPDRDRMLFTIRDLDLEDCTDLAGRLEPVQVREHLKQADVFLLSSLSEGLSNAALEAMACGLPVVTTDCGGMREAINDGVEGFVVPVRSPAALAEKLALLAKDANLRFGMGRAGRERVVHDFNLKDQIQLFHNLLIEAKCRV